MGMMTEILKEKRILTNVRLTVHQKAALVRAKVAQTPRIATDNTSKNASMVAARDQLTRLGLIDYDGTNTTVTPQGEQLMKDEALIDDTGELTELGRELAYDDTDQPQAGDETPGASEVSATPEVLDTDGEDFKLESFNLIRSFYR